MLSINELAILADDLTGACDVAASFASEDNAVEVCVQETRVEDDRSVLCVVNTQVRTFSPSESREKTEKSARFARSKRVLFVKVDSSLRGAVGAQIEGVLMAAGPRRVIVVPAIPSIGKTVKDGKIYDKGCPVQHGETGRDPVTPVLDSFVPLIISRTSNIAVEVYDAETDDEIDSLVEETIGGKSLLYVGSLGLANAVAKRFGRRPTRLEQCSGTGDKSRGLYSPRSDIRVLIISGSTYGTTARQLERAASHYKTEPLSMTRMATISEPDEIYSRSDVLILSLNEESQVGRFSPHAVARKIGTVGNRVLRGYRPDAIGIIGGETAYAIFNEIGASRVTIRGRISDVMPCGEFADGVLKGKMFATKGGSVGAENSVVMMIDYLRNSSNTSEGAIL